MAKGWLIRIKKSSQSRVSENGSLSADRSVSIDLLIKSLLALGATREDIATAIAGKQSEPQRQYHRLLLVLL